MHIAASKPLAISQNNLDPADIKREEAILREQARESGKNDAIIDKMVAGRIKKFYEEVCLLDQTYVIDGESKIADVLADAAKELGSPISVSDFALIVLGEGVEKKEDNDGRVKVLAANVRHLSHTELEE